jgi:catechol 2,3-dioxygenase-like lactoylglutathione lyase family enzyme
MSRLSPAPNHITHLRYVGLRVADLAGQREFYRDTWGLKETAVDSDVAHFAAALHDEAYVVRLRRSAAEGLDVLSLGVARPEHVDVYLARLTSLGARIISPPGELPGAGGGYGLRVFDPDGRTIEIACAAAPGTTEALAERDWRPGKLSHVVLNTRDIESLAAWYANALGLGIADRLADVMVFLHGASRDHHLIAVNVNDYPSINHVAFETRGLDEYMRASGRLMRQGIPCIWGPGRHGPGDNTFAYFQDRAGMVVEYTTALQQVEDWSSWRPQVHSTAPDWSDQWGTACLRQARPFLGIPEQSGFEAPPC